MLNKSLSMIGGLGLAYAQGVMLKKQRDHQDLMDVKLGLKTATTEDSSWLDKGVDHIKNLFSSKEVNPETAPATHSDSTGLFDRLSAGNIDQVGSEAYNRWGQGKVDGDIAQSTREGKRVTPGEAPTGSATLDQQASAPAEIATSIDQINGASMASSAGLQNAKEANNAQLEGSSSPDRTDTVSPKQWTELPEMSHSANTGMDAIPSNSNLA